MSTKLRFPQATSRRYLLRFLRPDLAPEDLTEATFAAFVKRSVFDADADALVDLSARVAAYDAGAGLATLDIAAEDTAELDPFVSLEWQVRATLADGRVLEHEAHRGPLVFDPLTGDPAIAEPPNAYLEPIASMASFVRVFSELVGLTGGTSAKLDGISSAALSALPNGALAELFFDDSIAARFRLRGRNTPETEYASAGGDATHPGGSVILCDNDSDRCWELVAVLKNGLPCTWNGETLRWHQLLATGTGEGVAPALTQATGGFLLPT